MTVTTMVARTVTVDPVNEEVVTKEVVTRKVVTKGAVTLVRKMIMMETGKIHKTKEIQDNSNHPDRDVTKGNSHPDRNVTKGNNHVSRETTKETANRKVRGEAAAMEDNSKEEVNVSFLSNSMSGKTKRVSQFRSFYHKKV